MNLMPVRGDVFSFVGLDTFPTVPVRNHTVIVGDYLKLECKSPISYPPAQVYWGTARRGASR